MIRLDVCHRTLKQVGQRTFILSSVLSKTRKIRPGHLNSSVLPHASHLRPALEGKDALFGTRLGGNGETEDTDGNRTRERERETKSPSCLEDLMRFLMLQPPSTRDDLAFSEVQNTVDAFVSRAAERARSDALPRERVEEGAAGSTDLQLSPQALKLQSTKGEVGDGRLPEGRISEAMRVARGPQTEIRHLQAASDVDGSPQGSNEEDKVNAPRRNLTSHPPTVLVNDIPSLVSECKLHDIFSTYAEIRELDYVNFESPYLLNGRQQPIRRTIRHAWITFSSQAAVDELMRVHRATPITVDGAQVSINRVKQAKTIEDRLIFQHETLDQISDDGIAGWVQQYGKAVSVERSEKHSHTCSVAFETGFDVVPVQRELHGQLRRGFPLLVGFDFQQDHQNNPVSQTLHVVCPGLGVEIGDVFEPYKRAIKEIRELPPRAGDTYRVAFVQFWDHTDAIVAYKRLVGQLDVAFAHVRTQHRHLYDTEDPYNLNDDTLRQRRYAYAFLNKTRNPRKHNSI